MPYAMIPIYTQTVGATPVANVIFNNIPSTFTDLMIEISGRVNAATQSTEIGLYFNGASYPATSAANTYIRGTGSGVTSSRTSSYTSGGVMPGANSTANVFGVSRVYIPNYLASGTKQIVTDATTENNATAADAWTIASSIPLSAINSITIGTANPNWVQYSTFTLYGIKNA